MTDANRSIATSTHYASQPGEVAQLDDAGRASAWRVDKGACSRCIAPRAGVKDESDHSLDQLAIASVGHELRRDGEGLSKESGLADVVNGFVVLGDGGEWAVVIYRLVFRDPESAVDGVGDSESGLWLSWGEFG